MRPFSTRCPVPGCQVLCHPDYLMCVRHWRLVASPLQRAVWSEFRVRPGSATHLAACQAAIRSAAKMAAVLPLVAPKSDEGGPVTRHPSPVTAL